MNRQLIARAHARLQAQGALGALWHLSRLNHDELLILAALEAGDTEAGQ